MAANPTKKAAQKRAVSAKMTFGHAAPKTGWGQDGNPEWAKIRPANPHQASMQITGRATSPTQGSGTLAPAKPAAAPASAGPTAEPFLTDAQKANLADWNTKYADDLAQLGQNDTLAQDKYNQGVATDTLANENNTDMANQSMAARGLFQSSIRDNALNDLNVTLAQQKIAMQTARDAALFTDQNQRNTLGAQNTAEQMTYNTDAIANAQAVTPTPTVGQAGAATGGAHPNPNPAKPATPAAPKPPTPVGPPKPQGVTTKPSPYRIGAGIPKVSTGFGYRGGF